MPEQIAQLLTVASKTTSQDPPKPFYILEFKPKGGPTFKISTFHSDHKKLDELKWYSVAYEVDGQYKNVKNKVDITPADEPTGPNAGGQSAPAGATSPYRQPMHPREQRSIHASIALDRANQLAIAGLIGVDAIPDKMQEFYDLLVAVSAPPPAAQPNGGTADTAGRSNGRADQSPTGATRTAVRGSQDVPTDAEWVEFWRRAGDLGMDADKVAHVLGKPFDVFRGITGVTEVIGIKKLDDYVAMNKK